MKNVISILSLVLLSLGLYGQSITTDTIALDEVVVTGSKVKVTRNNIPMTISVMTKDQLETSTESALLPALSEQIPGLFVTERGLTGFGVATGAAGQINMRGLGGNPTTQVLILIDGSPQFMGMMGHPLPDSYVTSDAERVEVIRGPGSILYGSNAFGGVINIITHKQINDGIEARGRLMYGSFNTQKYMASGGFRKKGFSIFASFNHDRTNGHRDSSDFKITNGYIKAGYEFNSHLKLYADFNTAAFETQDPGPIGGTVGERIDILRGKTAFSLENNYSRFEGALKLYYNYGDHDITDGWHSYDQMYGMMIYQGLKLFKGNTLTVGYDYLRYGGKGSPITTVRRDDEGNVIMPPQFVISDFSDRWIEISDNAVYGFVQQNILSNLILNAGIRFDINKIYGNEWIPEAGLAWNFFNNTSLKASVSKGYRPPSIRELYLFPPANEELLPERMMNYELVWSQRWLKQKMTTELALYLSDGDNLIVLVPPVAPPPPQYKNTGAFNNKGIEFSLKYQPIKGLTINTNYSYINMKTPLPATPEHNLFISGTYTIKKFQFNLKLQNIYNLYNQDGAGNISIVEKGYNLLDARLGYTINKYINIFVYGENLLGQKYQINEGYPMPGATFFGGINLKFDNKKSE
jgi:outer membrane receptor protein involved in Fe transport